MTGCLYISPLRVPGGLEVCPALLSDTLVTWEIDAPTKRTPCTVDHKNFGQATNVTLTRKLHIIQGEIGSCATAIAGDADKIRELLGTLRHRLPEWERQMPNKPMRAYGDVANLYRGKVEAIGIWGAPTAPNFNSMGCFGMKEVGPLGLCATVGSGGANFLLNASRNAATFEQMAGAPVAERIRGLATGINGVRMGEELAGFISDSTGGYVEYAYYDKATSSWMRGPKYLHMFAEIDNNGIANPCNRAVIYDPSEGGRILSLTLDETGFCRNFEFRLTPDEAVTPLDNFWNGWTPDAASMTLYKRLENTAWTMTRSTDPSDMEDISFSFKDGAFNFGFGAKFGKKLVDALNPKRHP